MTNCERRISYYLTASTSIVGLLYHGTCEDNANVLLANGWRPRSEKSKSANMGQSRYLYLTSGYEDALWFAEQKGCNTVMAIRNVPLNSLIVDPEDGTYDTVIEELNSEYSLPGKVALIKPLAANHFKLCK